MPHSRQAAHPAEVRREARRDCRAAATGCGWLGSQRGSPARLPGRAEERARLQVGLRHGRPPRRRSRWAVDPAAGAAARCWRTLGGGGVTGLAGLGTVGNAQRMAKMGYLESEIKSRSELAAVTLVPSRVLCYCAGTAIPFTLRASLTEIFAEYH